jgi:hypothetical protein
MKLTSSTLLVNFGHTQRILVHVHAFTAIFISHKFRYRSKKVVMMEWNEITNSPYNDFFAKVKP